MTLATPTMSKEDRASSDAWDIVQFHKLKKTNAEIRKDKKRFKAAVVFIQKENKERAEALKEENAARSAAVKQ